MSSFTQFTSIQPLPKSNKRITTQGFRYYVCVIGEEEDKRIILNSRGTGRGYNGYGYVKKGDGLIYFTYR